MDKKKLSLKEAYTLADGILRENTDHFIAFAFKDKEYASSGKGDTEAIAAMIALEMEDESVRDIIIRALAIYAKEHGTEIKVQLPDDISAN